MTLAVKDLPASSIVLIHSLNSRISLAGNVDLERISGNYALK